MRAALLMRTLPLLLVLCRPSAGQVTPYVGVIGGISTLSADAASSMTPTGLRTSSYAPSNGGALNVFAGIHLHDYFSVQADYIWNRNDLRLDSAASESNTFYQQKRSSSQNAAVFDVLIYFRNRKSRFRPYLGTGGGILHLQSSATELVASGGSPSLPPQTFSATRPVFRSHVGIDFRVAERLDLRYSFSESLSKNDISKHLSPPATRRLANFQNLFGLVVRF